jgi:rifampicin phosphotransferase
MKFITELRESNDLKLFGGKAINLSRLMKADFNVPDGFVISTEAYEKFVKTSNLEKIIKESLNNIDISSQKSLDEQSEIIKNSFLDSKMPEDISGEITENFKKFSGNFAVRSSATAEDLPTMSFAGLQDTYLNITPDNVVETVKQCFASLWTSRATSYRFENKIEQSAVAISVIIQKIIHADVSGVLFTINPSNNCYDEIVINSNFGLGESVVAGSIVPDSITFDKHTKEIIEKKLGSKESIVIPKKDGDTEEIESDKTKDFSLTETQIKNLTEISVNIEKEYGMPMDIEWAVENDSIFILQARPITTWIPLPGEMLTKPGEPKLLYIDFMITRQGIEKNFSVLGIDFFSYIQKPFSKSLMGLDTGGIKDGFTFYSHGRGYINLSNMMSVFGSRFLNQWERVADSVTLSIIKNNIGDYKIKERPKRLRYAGFLSLTKFVFSPRLGAYFQAYNHPEEYLAEVQEKEKWFVNSLKEAVSDYDSFHELSENIGELYNDFIMKSIMVTYSSEKARVQLDKMFAGKPELSEKVSLLERSLPGNITIEMGLVMFDLSQFAEIKNCENHDVFKSNLNSGNVSKEFKREWGNFISKFGFRCPVELDMISIRPNDSPEFLFYQLKQMSQITDTEMTPKALYQKSVKKREASFSELLEVAKEMGKEKSFRKNYEVMIAHGGYRETHKYFIVMLIDVMKREILKTSEKFVLSGRLKNAQQIFDLTVREIDEALADESFDMILRGIKNTQHIRKTAHVKYFPRVIDSRGKIAIPEKPEERDGLLVGEAISPGVVRGRVKVLNSPDEKPIHPGEILVARTTDPGWTPLFINASAIILEIGGMLQHGALVAREYGKPCVAGIISATEKLKDGQLVEVDGSNGVVKIIE